MGLDVFDRLGMTIELSSIKSLSVDTTQCQLKTQVHNSTLLITRVEVSTLKNAKLCKIGVECVEFM